MTRTVIPTRPSPLNSLQIAQAARVWRDERHPAIVVSVRATRGSVPREAGARMVVAAGAVAGTIGGGHLEQVAIERARQMLREGDSARLTLRLPLGPALGQCCGGEVVLDLVPLSRATLREPAPTSSMTSSPSSSPISSPTDDPDALADPDRWPAPPPRFTLQLYGAGHVGRAIAALLAGIACRVQWIDEREDQFPAGDLPAHVQRVCVEPVEAEVDHAPPGAFHLVLTHSHDLDLRITEAILRRGDFAFLGLIGSATKRARLASRLQARGLTAEQVARITCPIGIEGLRGKEPEVIAVSAVAQLLQWSSLPPARR